MNCTDCNKELTFKEVEKYHLICNKCWVEMVRADIFKLIRHFNIKVGMNDKVIGMVNLKND